MAETTLAQRQSQLAHPAEQVRVLEAGDAWPTFPQVLREHRIAPLRANTIEVLQVNVGKVCNQTCRHCHVDAGPDRRESMSRKVAAACLNLLRQTDIPTLDITGGAPEMTPHFHWMVAEARRLRRRVIDRCNLTILVAPGFDHLPQYLAAHEVEIVASLPCYLEANVDQQRGDRVFQRSLTALRRLNAVGYGQPDSPLVLNLVYNPLGPSLPPAQGRLESEYRHELRSRYGIEFTRLFTMTNLPISRFLDDLLRTESYDGYMTRLVQAFNPATTDGLMCRTTLSVDWEGKLYDCDFNQMLNLEIAAGKCENICDLDAAGLRALTGRSVVTGRHCFGCTAGAGSSCQGEIRA